MRTADIQNQTFEKGNVPKQRIFIAAFITQFCMGLETLLRMIAATPIKAEFFDATNPLTSGDHIGQVLGVLFLGYAISNFVISPFVDSIGMRRMHFIGVAVYLLGTLVVCLAHPGSALSYYLLLGGSLLQGLAWGCIEGSLNLLVVSLYPERKVTKLNIFHAAYSLGMLIAAPLCLIMEKAGLGWRIQLAMVFIPAIVSLAIVAQVKYPPSERVAHGVSFRQMFKSTLTRPLFYLLLCAMFLTTATEIAPANWMDLTLTKVVGIQGFWLVAFIYSIHVIVRVLAGRLNSFLSAPGILMLASAFALTGLLILSQAHDPSRGILGALIFGIGTALMFPTSLAAASERFPNGGSLTIGIVSSAGMLSSYVMMPIFGRIFDAAKISAAGGASAFRELVVNSPMYNKTLVEAASAIFERASLMPAATLLFFAVLWFLDSRAARKVFSPHRESASMPAR